MTDRYKPSMRGNWPPPRVQFQEFGGMVVPVQLSDCRHQARRYQDHLGRWHCGRCGAVLEENDERST